MAYVFGIDGGGTRSRMRIVEDSGEQPCRVAGESTNIYSVGMETALNHLRDLVLSACREAGIAPSQLQGGCFGSAGLDRPGEREAFRAFFHSLLPCPVRLCNDGEIMLVGGLGSTSGYCLISGTGSLALARNKAGQTARAGGLGYMLGDEGSACWIGWKAVCRALRSIENRDLPTVMLPRLLEHFHLERASDFVALMHQRFYKPQVAAAAELVAAAAGEGDPLALDICREAALELALLVESVNRQMPLPEKQIVLSGGVLDNNRHIRSLLLEQLAKKLPDLEVREKRGSGEEGAVLLARELLTDGTLSS